VSVVGHLWQQPAEVDRVGGGQPQLPSQLAVGERFLGEPLTVVERAFDGHREDVAAEGGELALLSRRDLAAWVEHRHPRPRDAVEGPGHGATGVSGGRHQHRRRLVAGGSHPGQQASQKASSHVLEGEGGTVKQLQQPQVLCREEGDDGDREIEGLGGQRLQVVAPQRPLDIRSEQGGGDLGKVGLFEETPPGRLR
jgi:hypothetical protein